MTNDNYFDCAFIGGGLAGLTSAIQLSKLGHRVIVFEKEQYPFHKVCGEYISLESWDYLSSLGLALKEMQLPIIKKLVVTAPSGNKLHAALPLGGFGISRYLLDEQLKNGCLLHQVTVLEDCKVEDTSFNGESFTFKTTKGIFHSRVCCGSYGKRSNIDIKWKRPFILQPPGKLNNYVAVKYHIRIDFPSDTIALHNFSDGYCGISNIEGGKCCLCYLTNAANLKRSNNSIAEMENKILSQNPHLKYILTHCTKLFKHPLSVSQVSFHKKASIERHVMMMGDAAGMITPLCGNGMSMAMHGGKIATGYIDSFLSNKTSREQMEKGYVKEWKKNFARRLSAGRFIQKMFGKPFATGLFISMMKKTPRLTRWLISQTHGDPF
jgi:flavin-dependent dehydrogenase